MYPVQLIAMLSLRGRLTMKSDTGRWLFESFATLSGSADAERVCESRTRFGEHLVRSKPGSRRQPGAVCEETVGRHRESGSRGGAEQEKCEQDRPRRWARRVASANNIRREISIEDIEDHVANSSETILVRLGGCRLRPPAKRLWRQQPCTVRQPTPDSADRRTRRLDNYGYGSWNRLRSRLRRELER